MLHVRSINLQKYWNRRYIQCRRTPVVTIKFLYYQRAVAMFPSTSFVSVCLIKTETGKWFCCSPELIFQQQSKADFLITFYLFANRQPCCLFGFRSSSTICLNSVLVAGTMVRDVHLSYQCNPILRLHWVFLTNLVLFCQFPLAYDWMNNIGKADLPKNHLQVTLQSTEIRICHWHGGGQKIRGSREVELKWKENVQHGRYNMKNKHSVIFCSIWTTKVAKVPFTQCHQI